MPEIEVLLLSRRIFMGLSLAGLAFAAIAEPTTTSVNPALLARALQALDRHSSAIPHRDSMGVIDFSLHSGTPRFHLVNIAAGSVRSLLVAHGRGSDPSHTGWLEHFSNEPRSNATSAGAYRTGSLYFGAHGRSMHLDGLDATNSNAAARAIVVHGAWYVSAATIGRSQGCFAVAPDRVSEVMSTLGPGRLIYADRV